MKIKKVGLFGKFNDGSVAGAISSVKKILEHSDLTVLLGNTTSDEIAGPRIDHSNPSLQEQIDIAVVVGGDGTMLNAARLLSDHGVPTVGVNLGRLGFLTDITFSEFAQSFGSILNNEYEIELRTLLQCQVITQGESRFSGIALNDIVISKGNTGRLIEFVTRVNGKYVSQTRSDGLILATPTGSTAYALSAGGPIIYPNLPVISMSPICPHTLSNRPIILSEDDEVEISEFSVDETHGILALDGVMSYELKGDERIVISRAANKLKMIRIKGFNYFETLHTKLGWNG